MNPALRTWAEIDLSAIRHNISVARRLIGEKPGILAVVKANAYGHGCRAVAGAVTDMVTLFGVANLEEALTIADLGRDIVLLSPCLPAERKAVVEAGFIATVSSTEEARAYAACGACRLNIKIDTGMGRIGLASHEAEEEIEEIAKIPGVTIHSISSHLPVSDEDREFTQTQLQEIDDLARACRRMVPQALIHCLNTAGILHFPDHAFDIVRAGLMLYGEASPPDPQGPLRQALTWKTRILLLRDHPAGKGISYGRTFITPEPTRVATLAVGYADGFPRQASGQGAHVLIGGQRCAVLGRVTMDQIMVDVSDVPSAQIGDEAVLLGRQGDNFIPASELAGQAGTISWDIFTGLKGRVRRFWHNGPGTEIAEGEKSE